MIPTRTWPIGWEAKSTTRWRLRRRLQRCRPCRESALRGGAGGGLQKYHDPGYKPEPNPDYRPPLKSLDDELADWMGSEDVRLAGGKDKLPAYHEGLAKKLQDAYTGESINRLAYGHAKQLVEDWGQKPPCPYRNGRPMIVSGLGSTRP